MCELSACIPASLVAALWRPVESARQTTLARGPWARMVRLPARRDFHRWCRRHRPGAAHGLAAWWPWMPQEGISVHRLAWADNLPLPSDPAPDLGQQEWNR